MNLIEIGYKKCNNMIIPKKRYQSSKLEVCNVLHRLGRGKHSNRHNDVATIVNMKLALDYKHFTIVLLLPA